MRRKQMKGRNNKKKNTHGESELSGTKSKVFDFLSHCVIVSHNYEIIMKSLTF